MTWQPITTAPHDGTPIDVWLGDADQNDVDFYCTPGTRCAAGWHWLDGRFQPAMRGLHIPVFVQPTHWRPIPEGPDVSIKTCKWTCDEGIYETECGETFIFNDGDARYNGAKYCLYCGNLLEDQP